MTATQVRIALNTEGMVIDGVSLGSEARKYLARLVRLGLVEREKVESRKVFVALCDITD